MVQLSNINKSLNLHSVLEFKLEEKTSREASTPQGINEYVFYTLLCWRVTTHTWHQHFVYFQQKYKMHTGLQPFTDCIYFTLNFPLEPCLGKFMNKKIKPNRMPDSKLVKLDITRKYFFSDMLPKRLQWSTSGLYVTHIDGYMFVECANLRPGEV